MKQMERLKKDISEDPKDPKDPKDAQADHSRDSGIKEAPLVAGAPQPAEVQYETAEEAAERREFAKLFEWADELHRIHKESNFWLCSNKHLIPF